MAYPAILQDPETSPDADQRARSFAEVIARRRPPPRGNLKAVELARWEALRWRYFQEPWTSRVCAVRDCGATDGLILHHGSYDNPRTTELLAVVPMCPPCHKVFELKIWPAARGIVPRWQATMMFMAHGHKLLEWVEWATPIQTEVAHYDQLPLWSGGP